MKQKKFNTIREYLYWNYSNLAMAHYAITNEHSNYCTSDYMIRAKLYSGLTKNTMHIASLYNDERDKLNNNVCCYCGYSQDLSLDHLVPRFSGGLDSGENIVYACKRCNSSKGKNDLIVWYLKRDQFPPILVLRRYLKLAIAYFEKEELLDLPFSELCNNSGAFRVDLLPYEYPQPYQLRL